MVLFLGGIVSSWNCFFIYHPSLFKKFQKKELQTNKHCVDSDGKRRSLWSLDLKSSTKVPFTMVRNDHESRQGPLTCPFARSLAPLTYPLAPHCALCSHALMCSFVCLLAHSLTLELARKWVIRCREIRLFWTMVALNPFRFSLSSSSFSVRFLPSFLNLFIHEANKDPFERSSLS